MSPKFCAACGAAVVSGACSGCGAPVVYPQDSGASYTEASYASSYLDPPPPPAPPVPPAPPAGSPSGGRPGLLVVLVVAGVLLLGAVVGVFTVLLRNQDGKDVAASTSQTQAQDPQAQGSPAPQGGGGGEAVPPPAAQADVITDSTWVLVLESYEQSQFSLDYARARAAEISPDALVLDSSATVGMNSGYWAVVYGGWSNKEAARDSCYQVGRSAGGTCYPRHLN